jgi:hypothetical protein
MKNLELKKRVYSNNNVEIKFFNIIKTDNCEDNTLKKLTSSYEGLENE